MKCQTRSSHQQSSTEALAGNSLIVPVLVTCQGADENTKLQAVRYFVENSQLEQSS